MCASERLVASRTCSKHNTSNCLALKGCSEESKRKLCKAVYYGLNYQRNPMTGFYEHGNEHPGSTEAQDMI
jgi:hypothetical protein